MRKKAAYQSVHNKHRARHCYTYILTNVTDNNDEFHDFFYLLQGKVGHLYIMLLFITIYAFKT